MQISIQVPKGKTITIEVEKHETVLQMKEKIFAQTGIPVGEQGIILGGKALADDNASIESYRFSGENYHLYQKLSVNNNALWNDLTPTNENLVPSQNFDKQEKQEDQAAKISTKVSAPLKELEKEAEEYWAKDQESWLEIVSHPNKQIGSQVLGFIMPTLEKGDRNLSLRPESRRLFILGEFRKLGRVLALLYSGEP
jgi:hypothetical protein